MMRMNSVMKQYIPGRWKTPFKWVCTSLAVIGLALAIVLAVAVPAFSEPAGATATPATGGNNISIDTTSAPGGSGTWTALGSIAGPTITEGAAGQIAAGLHTLTLPEGWEFKTNQSVSIGLNGTDLVLGSGNIIPGTNTLSFYVATASYTAAAVLNFSQICVRPTGTTVSTDNMVQTVGTITGITNDVTNFGTFSTVHGAANKFTIIDPTDGTVDAAITVTVQLQDQFGNVVSSGGDKDKDVTLNTSGAATGDGLVNISNGTGTKDIFDEVAESVNLTLTDSQTTHFDVSSTQDVVFGPGAATSLDVTGITDPVAAGSASDVTVTARDQYDNVATGYTGTITFSSSDNGTSTSLPENYTFLVGDNGAKTFAGGVTLTTAGEQSVTATDNAHGGITGSQTAITVTHGNADKFVILNPTDGTVDNAITVTVKLEDQYGNVVSSGDDKDKDVTLAADGAATGDGLVDIANGTGTKDISDHTAQTVNLTLEDSQTTQFDVSSTQDVVFAHGAATKFVIIDPTDGTVDAAITVTVKLEDQYGNVVNSGGHKDDDVTLNTNLSATGDGLVNISNGTGTKDISDEVAESVNLTLEDSQNTHFDVSSTQDVVFGPGAAISLDVTGITDPVEAGTATDVTVTARDQYDNVATGYTGTVTFSSSDNGTSTSLPEDYAFLGGDSGAKTFAGGVRLITAGEQSVTATDTAHGSISGNQTAITVNHGDAYKFVIIDPDDGTVDAAITVTVKLEDQYGNIINSGDDKDDNVTLNTSGAATGGGVVSISNGVGTRDISDHTAQTVNLTLTDTGETEFDVSSTQDVVFAHGAASKFVIINPTDGTVDAAITVTVKLEDQYGNIINSGDHKDDDVTLNTSGAATGGGVVSISNGVGTRDISDQTAQTVNLTLEDSQTTHFNVSSTQDVVFAHGAASKFVILNPTDGTVDNAITVTVKLEDQYGNIISSGDDKDKDVTLAADGAATGDGVVDISNGTGTRDISDHTAQTVNLTLEDSQTTNFDVSSTQDVVFAHGATSKFVILNPADGTVDAAITVTVQLQDQYGNIVSSGDDKDKDVTLNTSGNATGGDVVSISSGTGTRDISDQTAQTVNLTLEDSQETGFNVSSTQDVVFGAGAAVTLDVAGITDPVAAGTASDVTVTARDQYDNVATGYTGTVTFSSSDNGTSTSLPEDYAFLGGDSGAKTFAGGVRLITAGEQSVTATDTAHGSISGNQTAITVNHGDAYKFVIIDPDDGTVDAAITVTVKLEDQYGNIINSGDDKDDNVTLNTSGAATGGGVVSISNGVGTRDISDHTAQTVNLTLTDTGETEFDVSSTQDVVFAHGAASKFVIINPTDGTVDAAITVTVKLEDQYGNIINSGDHKDDDVTLNTSGNATGGGVVSISNGVGTRDISDQTAQTVNLTLEDSQTTHFNVSSTQDVVFGPGVAAYLTVTGTDTMTAGSNNELTVRAYDNYDNLCSSGVNKYNGAHNLTFSGPAVIGDHTPQVEDTDIDTPVADVAFTNGVTNGTLTLVAYKAEVTTIDVTDNTIDSSGGNGLALTVRHAAAASLNITTSTTTPVAGTAINITITAKDAYGNIANGANGATPYTGSVLLWTDATSPTWHTSVYGFTAVNAGTKTLTGAITFTTVESNVAITGRDSAVGTITGSKTGITVTAEPGAPAVAITDPVAGAAVSGTYTIEFTTNDGATTAAQVSIDGGTYVAATTNADPGTYSWNTSLLANGSHTIQVKDTVSGVAGYSSLITVIVNNGNVPSFTWTVLIPGATLDYAATVNASWSITGSYDAGSVKYSLNGGAWTSTTTNTTLTGLTGVNVGTNTLRLMATNTVGGVGYSGYSSINTFVMSDQVVPEAPVVAITDPVAGAAVSGTYTIKFTTNDGATTAAQVSIDGGTYVAATTNADPGTYSWNTSLLANGSHTIQVKDTVSGVAGYSSLITVIVNNGNVPSFTWTVLIPGATLDYAATVNASWLITGSYDAGSVKYSLNGGAWTSTTTNTTLTGLTGVNVGTNTLRLMATNTVGGVGYSGYSSINTFVMSDQVVPEAPVVAITDPVAGAAVSGTYTIEFTTNDGATTAAQVSIDGGTYVAATTNADPGTYSWNTSLLANGSHTIQVKDTVSGVAGYSSLITVIVNNGNVPSFTWTVLIPGATLDYAATVNASWSITGSYDAGSVKYSLNGGAWTSTTTNTTLTGLTGVNVGTNTLRLMATNTVGGVGYSGYSSINTFVMSDQVVPEAPVVAITDPVAGAAVSGTYTIKFTTNDGATTAAQVSIDGGTYVAATTNADPGTYSWNTSLLANGSHTIQVKDTVSGVAGYSSLITVIVNNGNVPSFTWTVLIPGATLDYAATVNASWSITGSYDAGSVKYSLNGGAWTSTTTNTTLTGLTGVNVGTNTLRLMATNTVGGVGYSGYSSINTFVMSDQVVPEAPVVAITDPVAGAAVSGTYTVEFTTNDGATTAAQVSIDGGTYVAATTNADPGTYSWNTSLLANGSHTIQVKDTVSGVAGYSSLITVIVNNGNVPSFTWTVLIPGATLDYAATVNASWSITGSYDAGSVKYSLNGGAWTSTTTNTTLTGLTGVNVGTNTLRLMATNTVGGVGYSGYSSINTFVMSDQVVPEAPVVAITDPVAGAAVSGTYTVEFTTNDGATTAAQVSIDGGTYVAATTNADPGTYSWNTSLLANGSHTIQVKDTVSGVAGYSSLITVIVNNGNVPSFTWTVLIPGATLDYAATVNASWSITGSYDAGSVKYSLNGGAWTSTTTATTLTGLSGVNVGANTLRLMATNTVGGVGYSGYSSINTFVMASGAPVISSMLASDIDTTSANITWETDVTSSGNTVEYGTTSALGLTQATTTGTGTSHEASLSGLSPNKVYYYRVKSTAGGTTTYSDVITFTTAPSGIVVTGVSATRTYATANGTYANGWAWTFSVTVPTSETSLAMKFANWVSGSNVIAVAGNMRFYSAQAAENTTDTAITIAAAATYSDPMTLTGDLDASKGGRQIEITVEAKVPEGSVGGSYTTSYGIEAVE